MNHIVDIRQLSTGNGAFMNVDANAGHIKIQFCVYANPTYYMKPKANDKSISRGIIQFDDEAWAQEYISEHGGVWDFIRLDSKVVTNEVEK